MTSVMPAFIYPLSSHLPPTARPQRSLGGGSQTAPEGDRTRSRRPPPTCARAWRRGRAEPRPALPHTRTPAIWVLAPRSAPCRSTEGEAARRRGGSARVRAAARRTVRSASIRAAGRGGCRPRTQTSRRTQSCSTALAVGGAEVPHRVPARDFLLAPPTRGLSRRRSPPPLKAKASAEMG